MIDRQYAPDTDPEDGEAITVSVEAEAGEEFLSRLNGLTRVSKAVVRTVRPNPGWSDLETELAREASASDAHKTEVTMTARRRGSCSVERDKLTHYPGGRSLDSQNVLC